jgi:hypothetical protein
MYMTEQSIHTTERSNIKKLSLRGDEFITIDSHPESLSVNWSTTESISPLVQALSNYVKFQPNAMSRVTMMMVEDEPNEHIRMKTAELMDMIETPEQYAIQAASIPYEHGITLGYMRQFYQGRLPVLTGQASLLYRPRPLQTPELSIMGHTGTPDVRKKFASAIRDIHTHNR